MAGAAAPLVAEWRRLACGGDPADVPNALAAASSLPPSPPCFAFPAPHPSSPLSSPQPSSLSLSLSPSLLPALPLPLLGLHPHSLLPASCHLSFGLAHRPGAPLSSKRQTHSSDSLLLRAGRRAPAPHSQPPALRSIWLKGSLPHLEPSCSPCSPCLPASSPAMERKTLLEPLFQYLWLGLVLSLLL